MISLDLDRLISVFGGPPVSGRLRGLHLVWNMGEVRVHGHQLPSRCCLQGLRPVKQIRGKLIPVEQSKHPPKGVMRRRSFWQRQKLLQPLELHLGEGRQVAPIIRSTRYSQH